MKKHQDINKKVICLRPFNTFGPYQSERAIIPEIIIKCLKGETIKTTEGLQTREFNYVDNIVDGFIASVDISKFPDNPINIGSRGKFQLKIWLTIHKLTNSSSSSDIGSINTRPTEIWRMQSDSKKAESILNGKEKINFEDGLNLTINGSKNLLKYTLILMDSQIYKTNDRFYWNKWFLAKYIKGRLEDKLYETVDLDPIARNLISRPKIFQIFIKI